MLVIRIAKLTTVAAAFVVFTAAASSIETRSLAQHIEEAVGSTPLDCGTHTLTTASRATLEESLACGRRALSARNPFVIIQRGPGEDSEIAWGVLGRSDGSVFWFDYDSAPCGGSGCEERFVVKPCALSGISVGKSPHGTYWMACGRSDRNSLPSSRGWR